MDEAEIERRLSEVAKHPPFGQGWEITDAFKRHVAGVFGVEEDAVEVVDDVPGHPKVTVRLPLPPSPVEISFTAVPL